MLGQGLDLVAAQAGRPQGEIPVEVADRGDVRGIPAGVCLHEGMVHDGAGTSGLGLQQEVAHGAEQGVVAAEPDLQVVVGDRRAAPEDAPDVLGVLEADQPGLGQRVDGHDGGNPPAWRPPGG